MARETLTDGSGRWFSTASSVRFDEQTRWNGNNHISVATGSQWDHESLYYTASGKWILHHWSQWQGSLPSYIEVDEDDAITWLGVNECWEDDGIDTLPKEIQIRVKEGFAAKEM